MSAHIGSNQALAILPSWPQQALSANAVSAEGMIVDVFAFCVFYHFIPTVTLSCTNKDKTLG